jgi:hypothetical protein
MASGLLFFVLSSIVMPASPTLARNSDSQVMFHRLEQFYQQIGSDQLEMAMHICAPDAQILLGSAA